MKFLTGGLVSDLSGKLGNLVASRARGGISYMRTFVTPTNPQTPLQQGFRDSLGSASAYWRDVLTEPQQQAWIDYAAGQTGNPSGQTLFVGLNQRRFWTGTPTATPRKLTFNGGGSYAGNASIVVTPPVGPSAAWGTQPTTVIDDSDNRLVVGAPDSTAEWVIDADVAAPSILWVRCTVGQTASRQARRFAYQTVAALFITDPEGMASVNVPLATLGIPTVAGYVHYVELQGQAPDGRVTTKAIRRVTVQA